MNSINKELYKSIRLRTFSDLLNKEVSNEEDMQIESFRNYQMYLNRQKDYVPKVYRIPLAEFPKSNDLTLKQRISQFLMLSRNKFSLVD
jgi:hypothetical protein